jgi:AAHS family 4-hydroxybenzoate transporter-like MFS transporter
VIMLCGLGFAIGAGSAGFVTAFFLPRWGWQSLFFVGGAVPLVLLILVARQLPESIRFLVLTKAPGAEIARILGKLDPKLRFSADVQFVLPEVPAKGTPVGQLFAAGRSAYTVLLWLSVFTNLLVLYFIITWLPTLFTTTGMSIETAATTVGMFGIGGPVGVALLGFVIDRFGAPRVLGTGFVIAGATMTLLGSFLDSRVLVVGALMIIGFFISGGNGGTSAYASAVYPTAIRSTGIGWALGIGRAGAFVAPLIGSAMVAAHWGLPAILHTIALFEFVAAAAMLLTSRALPTPALAAASAR